MCSEKKPPNNDTNVVVVTLDKVPTHRQPESQRDEPCQGEALLVGANCRTQCAQSSGGQQAAYVTGAFDNDNDDADDDRVRCCAAAAVYTKTDSSNCDELQPDETMCVYG